MSATDLRSPGPLHIGFLTPEYVTPRSGDGGLANYLKKTAHALSARGHRVTIVLLSDANRQWRDGDVDIREVKSPGAPGIFSRIPGIRRVTPALRWYLSARRIAGAVRKIHRQTPFSILQASSYCAPGFCLQGNPEVPVVCRISSYTPLWRSAYGRRRGFDELLLDWMEARQVAEADAAFAPSAFIAGTFTRLEAVNPEVIPTDLDSGEIEDDPSFHDRHLQGRKYLLFFGTLSFIKGIGVIAQALPGILDRHPDLHMVFIGRDDGIPGGKTAFQHVREACPGRESRLFHHAALPKRQLLPVVARCVAVLMPSLADNYPNACLEAQARGSIVVGSRDSSLEEMIEDGLTGFLSGNRSAASLAEAVGKVLAQSPMERSTMRDAILERVDAIRKEDRIGALIRFYGKVCDGFASRQGAGK